uniref:Uncharacterized protein n=1 Tax=Zooxanthella nutricula TaxID=1333877 RepID=A0A7S2LGU8_9DINO
MSSPRKSCESIFDRAKSIINGEDERPNAGEVRLCLHVSAAAEEHDEWFAFCFPRPIFEVFPSHVVNFEDIYRDIVSIVELLREFLQAVSCILVYIVSWRFVPLSAVVLVWMWCACTWPAYVLPTIWLWLALFLGLLRNDAWQAAMLVHARNAHLNDEGLRSMARFDDPGRMEIWLMRVIAAMGRGVSHAGRVHELASLLVRDGKPVMDFKDLVANLSAQPWLYHPSGRRRCHAGHTLAFLGAAPSDQTWRCQSPLGCRKFVDRIDRAQLRVCHYHCRTCGHSLCETCVARITRPPLWMGVPAEMIPDHLEVALAHIEEPLGRCRTSLELASRLASLPFQNTELGTRAACTVYVACAVAMLACFLVAWTPVGSLLHFGWRCGLVAACSASFLTHLPVFMKLPVYVRASHDFGISQHRRSMGPLSLRWAFFVADDADNGGATRPAHD